MNFFFLFIGLNIITIASASFRSKNINKVRYFTSDNLIKFCMNQMSLMHNKEVEWSCSLTENSNISIWNRLYCFCSHDYVCVDNEQFHLESELVDASQYVKGENSGGHVYKSQCEYGLNTLTNETNWRCEPQFDRLDTNEFYCECERESMCQRHKILKFKIDIRVV